MIDLLFFLFCIIGPAFLSVAGIFYYVMFIISLCDPRNPVFRVKTKNDIKYGFIPFYHWFAVIHRKIEEAPDE